MEQSEIKHKVYDVIAQVLKVDPGQIRDSHAFTTDLGAESVQSVELMAGFEEAFDIEIDEDDALAVQTVSGAIQYIAKFVD
jgi:acyl carrier protein